MAPEEDDDAVEADATRLRLALEELARNLDALIVEQTSLRELCASLEQNAQILTEAKKPQESENQKNVVWYRFR